MSRGALDGAGNLTSDAPTRATGGARSTGNDEP